MANDDKQPVWEHVSAEPKGPLVLITERQAVPGGWLYMLRSNDSLYPSSVVFVPNPVPRVI